jgi:hypothetical protein
VERGCRRLDAMSEAEFADLEVLLLPWVRREYRRRRRDRAILELGRQYIELGRGRAIAEACARDLSRYRESGWQREQGKAAAGDTKRALLHQVLVLNRGKTIGRDRIREILAGVAGKNRQKAATDPVTPTPITCRSDDAITVGQTGCRRGRRS